MGFFKKLKKVFKKTTPLGIISSKLMKKKKKKVAPVVTANPVEQAGEAMNQHANQVVQRQKKRRFSKMYDGLS